jgi:hypothetical protein
MFAIYKNIEEGVQSFVNNLPFFQFMPLILKVRNHYFSQGFIRYNTSHLGGLLWKLPNF